MAGTSLGTALVTGASSGIGAAFARLLAARGSDLVLVARRRERLQQLGDELTRAHGVRVEILTADLTDPEQRRLVEARLREDPHPVELLVNNAGFGTTGAFADLPVDREETEAQLNMVVPLRLAHAALRGMTARGRGAVLNVSSLAGFQPLPYTATYGASKAFLTSFSQALHEEVRPHGVTVLALCPGFTRTEFQGVADASSGAIPDAVWMTPEAVATEGLDALASGQAVSVPGLQYKALAVLSWAMPSVVTRKLAASFYAQRATSRD